MKNSRAKGAQAERDVAKMFRRWFTEAHRAGLGQGSFGHHSPDVGGTPFYIEVKRYGKKGLPHSIEVLYDKAYSDMMLWRDEEDGRDLPVIIVWRIDRSEWQVSLIASDWRALAGFKQRPDDAGAVKTLPWWVFSEAMDQNYPFKEANDE